MLHQESRYCIMPTHCALLADRAEGSDTETDLEDNASESGASERSETESEASPEHRTTTLSRFGRPAMQPGGFVTPGWTPD